MNRYKLSLFALFLAFVVVVGGMSRVASAENHPPLHPDIELLDKDGQNVLDSGQPLSTEQTCGTCHDTEFISTHSNHAEYMLRTDSLPRYPGNAPEQVDVTAVEMNCLTCHTANPNNAERLAALAAGNYDLATMATLLGTDIVDQSLAWNRAVFTEDGRISADTLTLQDPTNNNCAQCHGLVHDEVETPLVEASCTSDAPLTLQSGAIMSPQRIAQSGLNVSGKDALSRSFDVHSERVVGCTECHYSLNNPVYQHDDKASQPDHLSFDPRRLDIDAYLYRPIHDVATKESAELACTSCHNPEPSHDWLPYLDQHLSALACETCHIPKLYAPAQERVDWTVLQAANTPVSSCRGIESQAGSADLITGYQPVLLTNAEDKLAPYNLITAYFWVDGEDQTPVALEDVNAAYFDGTDYRSDVLSVFDTNGDGRLSKAELVIDSAEKTARISANLNKLGYASPAIKGEVEPIAINHNVAESEWAVRDCNACHGEKSRITQALPLGNNTPNDVLPTLSGDTLQGNLHVDTDGMLFYQP
ncbi:MAG TPA: hypothetical protein ENJ56_04670, partial [Anaerolineae bacterium]|nr:hypothetical protein [Anaerolineae bacterium]